MVHIFYRVAKYAVLIDSTSYAIVKESHTIWKGCPASYTPMSDHVMETEFRRWQVEIKHEI